MVQIEREATTQELVMFRQSDEDSEQRFAQMIARLPDPVAVLDSPLARMLAMRRRNLDEAGRMPS